MEELETALIDALNKSELPLEAKAYVAKTVAMIVKNEFQKKLLEAQLPKPEEAPKKTKK